MKIRHYFLSLLAAPALLAFATSCGGGEGENKGGDSTHADTTAKPETNKTTEGPKLWTVESATEEDKIGERMCNCLAEGLSAAGADVQALIAIDKAQLNQDAETLGKEETLKKYPALAAMVEKTNGMPPPPCFDEIEKEMKEKKVDQEKALESLRKGCNLPMQGM